MGEYDDGNQYDELDAIDGARLIAKHRTDAEYHKRFEALRNWYERRMEEIEYDSKKATFELGTDAAYIRLASYLPFNVHGLNADTEVWRVEKGSKSEQNQYKPGKWETIRIQHVDLCSLIPFDFGYGPLSDVLVVAVLEEKQNGETTTN